MDKLVDRHGREVNYLRLSVTERCNLNCFYCRGDSSSCSAGEHDAVSLNHEDYLNIVRAFASSGVEKVRITGGEPLLVNGIERLVKDISGVKGIKEITMTTNACYLRSMAGKLAEAGVSRVNISLDSLQEANFKYITNGGLLNQVWEGIEAAVEAGLVPVKINVVLLKNINHREVMDFARLTIEKPMDVRFIEFMPFGEHSREWEKYFLSLNYVEEACSTLGEIEPVEGDHGAGPARYVRIRDGSGKIGLITPLSRHFCSVCNRLRVTAEGKIRPCLFSSQEVDLRPCLGQADPVKSIKKEIKRALEYKPDPGKVAQGVASRVKQMNKGSYNMNSIGG